MSEVVLLSFGCAVSFIVVAAVYIFVTEDLQGAESPRAQRERTDGSEAERLSKVA